MEPADRRPDDPWRTWSLGGNRHGPWPGGVTAGAYEGDPPTMSRSPWPSGAAMAHQLPVGQEIAVLPAVETVLEREVTALQLPAVSKSTLLSLPTAPQLPAEEQESALISPRLASSSTGCQVPASWTGCQVPEISRSVRTTEFPWGVPPYPRRSQLPPSAQASAVT